MASDTRVGVDAPGPGSRLKYRGFISYRALDRKVASWLQGRLERFRLPKDVGEDRGNRRLGKFYRDRTDAAGNVDLEGELRDALAQSENLIVVCTPRAAAPDSWVDREILAFRGLRPGAKILPIIADGEPPACFPRSLIEAHPSGPLAADMRKSGDGREKAFVKLVAGLAGLDFDNLWRRERRRRVVRLAAGGAVAAVILFGLTIGGDLLLRSTSEASARVSREFADYAQQATDAGSPDLAVRLALAGVIDSDLPLIGYDASSAEVELDRAVHASIPLTADLSGHTGPVMDVVFSPDGTVVATASRDGTVKLWNAAGRNIATLRGHTGPVWMVAFSPDGKFIASASADGTARLWNTAAGACASVLPGHAGGANSVAFSSDSKLLVSTDDRDARIWRVSDGALLRTLHGHQGRVLHASFSPTADVVATASEDWSARIWDIASGRVLHVLSHNAPVSGLAFSPDGYSLVTGATDGHAIVWNIATGAQMAVLDGHERGIWSVSYSPDGYRIVTGSDDRSAIVWDAGSGRILTRLLGHEGRVWSAVFSPDGSRIATASQDGNAGVWDSRTGNLLEMLGAHTDSVQAVAFSRDGSRLATASWDKHAKIWDLSQGRAAAVLNDRHGMVEKVAFSPDGRQVLTLSQRSLSPEGPQFDVGATGSGLDAAGARIWDVANGEEAATLSAPGLGSYGFNRAEDAKFSPDGSVVAVATGELSTVFDRNGNLRFVVPGGEVLTFSRDSGRIGVFSYSGTIVDVRTGRTLAEIPEASDRSVRAAAFSANGREISTLDYAGMLRTYDATSARTLRSLRVLNDDPDQIGIFSADGALLAVSGTEGIKVWDVARGRRVATITSAAPGQRICAMLFSADGRFLAVASLDATTMQSGTATIYDAKTGKAVTSLDGHSRYVLGFAFSPDNLRIATASADGTARIWDVATGRTIATLYGHESNVIAVAFSNDQRTLATGSADGTARLWDVGEAIRSHGRDLVVAACERVVRTSPWWEHRLRTTALPASMELEGALRDNCRPPSLFARLETIAATLSGSH